MNNSISEMMFCRNCYLKMLSNIVKLPNELKNMVFEFICFRVKTLLNKQLYFDNCKYYNIKYNDTYVRKLLRNDYYFLFKKYMVVEKIYDTFRVAEIHMYKHKRFKTYRDYLKYLCDMYEANKCRVLLQ